jgi:hypothetical protein
LAGQRIWLQSGRIQRLNLIHLAQGVLT